MNFVLRPWQLLLLILAGWINRDQQDAIEYLLTENQVLREKLGKGRILLNDDQRRRLAVKGKVLGRKSLGKLAKIVRPDTLLRWHRELIARKWDHSDKRQSVGRPRIRQQIVDLALRMAQENSSWGYDRIQGALANLGFHISDTTVGNILKAHGSEPAPERESRTAWRTFLAAHWDLIAAADFTTVEVWTRSGLVTFYVLVVMHLKTRRIEIAGATPHPNSEWMQPVGRNLTDCVDGFFRSSTHVILDRDTKHLPVRQILKSSDIEAVVLPPKSPNLNAHLERFMRSLKSECLNRMIFFGEASLRRAWREFGEHFHHERNHQGLANRSIDAGDEVGRKDGELSCRPGLVAGPMEFSISDLLRMAGEDLAVGFECSGNSPRRIHGLVGNGRWTGVSVRTLLNEVGVKPAGREVVFFGADKGEEEVEFRGRTYNVEQEFGRSISIETAMTGEPLLAYALNGEPLTRHQGFPLRVIMPGWYGVANVKWLAHIHVQEKRYLGKYQARWYRTLRAEMIDGEVKYKEIAISKLQLKSVIARVTQEGNRHKVLGFVLNDGTPLRSVEVKVDDGAWRPAAMDSSNTKYSWKLFSYMWNGATPGEHTLVSRVTDENGNVQRESLDEKMTGLENHAQFPRTVMIG